MIIHNKKVHGSKRNRIEQSYGLSSIEIQFDFDRLRSIYYAGRDSTIISFFSDVWKKFLFGIPYVLFLTRFFIRYIILRTRVMLRLSVFGITESYAQVHIMEYFFLFLAYVAN